MAWTTPKTWTSTLVSVADLNTHIRDNLNMIAYRGSSSWTPTLTNWTVGNGTLSGQYQAVGLLTFFHLELVLGSTSTTVGTLAVSLPFTASTGTTRQGVYGILYDNSSGNAVFAHSDITSAATTFGPYYEAGTGASPGLLTVINGTQPWTWATSDILRFTGCYLSA